MCFFSQNKMRAAIRIGKAAFYAMARAVDLGLISRQTGAVIIFYGPAAFIRKTGFPDEEKRPPRSGGLD